MFIKTIDNLQNNSNDALLSLTRYLNISTAVGFEGSYEKIEYVKTLIADFKNFFKNITNISYIKEEFSLVNVQHFRDYYYPITTAYLLYDNNLVFSYNYSTGVCKCY